MRVANGRLGLLVCLSACLPVCEARAYDEAIDAPMYRSPDLPGPRGVVVFPEKALALWLRALERPEADLKCKAADAFAQARRRGVKGLQAAVAPLLAALDRLDQPPTVRLAVARALVALDAREAAGSLWRHAESGSPHLRELVEGALARWDYRPARVAWLARLRDPATTHRKLVLAIRGLGAVREGLAADRLRELTHAAGVHGAVRLEAARALGSIRPDGLEKDAERLAAETSVVGRLAAVSLLQRHGSAEAVRLLQRLARDTEPAVASPAVVRLTEIDAKLVVPAIEHLLAVRDPAVRALAVEVLRREPSGKHVRLLADRLDDVHPDVREKARRALHELAAKNEFRDRALADTTRVLAGKQWRGQEQAALLLTQLDHKPAVGRLVELLASDRPEVAVTAAWGLRRLAVADTLPRVLGHVQAGLARARTTKGLPEHVDYQLSQLNQFLGQQKYRPADAVLRGFVPPLRPSPLPEARAAAVWALGLIHEGELVPALATALEGRLQDLRSIPPEDLRVCWMAALTLGRMRAKQALASLREFYPHRKASDNPINNACGWAIEQITGEVMAPAGTVRQIQRDWFLTPSD